MTPDLVKDFFDYFGDGGHQTLCNFYGSTEMMDVTFATFRSAEDANRLALDGKVRAQSAHVSRDRWVWGRLNNQHNSFVNGFPISIPHHTWKVPIGRPVANTAAFVLDKDMRPVESGVVGELYIASYNLALGYAGTEDQG